MSGSPLAYEMSPTCRIRSRSSTSRLSVRNVAADLQTVQGKGGGGGVRGDNVNTAAQGRGGGRGGGEEGQ